MSYRSVLVHLDNSPRMPERVRTAAELAAAYDARLVGVAPVGVIETVAPFAVMGAEVILGDWMSQLEADAERAVERFKVEAAKYPLARVEGHVVAGDSQAALAWHGRQCDLIVMAQPDPGEKPGFDRRHLAEFVMLAVGRPVLMLPYASDVTTIGTRALVAWKSARESTRALADALPFLKRSEAVRVAVVCGTAGEEETDLRYGSEAIGFLAAHGIQAGLAHERSAVDAGATLLSVAADWQADLMVVGAYGHSHMREWVLGGVTQSLLRSMTLPVLFSH